MIVVSRPPDQHPGVWSAGAETYRDWFEPLSVKFTVNALRLLRLRPGARLLDVAAGTGALTLGAAAAGLDVCAVDFAPGMVRLLGQRLAATGRQAHLAQMDGQALSFASASFDAACSMFGLVFFPDLDAGARELRRVVRPGGQVLIAGWDRTGFPLQTAVARALQVTMPSPASPGSVPPVFRVGDRASLAALLTRAGLRDVAVLEVTHDWDVPDPAGLFRSLPRLGPQQAALSTLNRAEFGRASAAFADAVAEASSGSGRLRTTALFGYGIR